MKSRIARALGVAGMLIAAAPATADPALAPFTAVYDVLHGTHRVGEATFTLRAGDGSSYVFESRTEAKGIAKVFAGTITETSDFTLDESGPRPVRFSAQESRGHSSQSVTFDWATGIAHSERDGERADIALRPRVLDHSLIEIALMSDLKAGRALAPYHIVEKNALRSYAYDHASDETAQVPAGSFETAVVRQRREGSSRELYFWCAPKLDYLPVKLEQRKEGEALFTMVLKSVQGL
jgi:hypothetical protein